MSILCQLLAVHYVALWGQQHKLAPVELREDDMLRADRTDFICFHSVHHFGILSAKPTPPPVKYVRNRRSHWTFSGCSVPIPMLEWRSSSRRNVSTSEVHLQALRVNYIKDSSSSLQFEQLARFVAITIIGHRPESRPCLLSQLKIISIFYCELFVKTIFLF